MVLLEIRPAGGLIVKEAIKTPPPQSFIDMVLGYVFLVLIVVIIVAVIILILKWFADRKQRRKDVYTKDYIQTTRTAILNRSNEYFKPILNLPFLKRGVGVYGIHPTLYFTEAAKGKKDTEFRDVKDNKGKKIEPEGEPTTYLKIEEGRVEKIGTYLGDYTGMDGCKNILIASAKEKIFGLFPKKIIMKIRLKSYRTINKRKKDGDTIKYETKFIENPQDLLSMSKDGIYIHCLSIEHHGEYYYPVMIDGEGRVADSRSHIVHDIFRIPLEQQVIDFGRATSKVVGEAVDSSPFVKTLRKTGTDLSSE